MNNRTELKRQLTETRAQMNRLEAELERTEEWEPEDGDWIVTLTGKLTTLPSYWKEQVAFGVRRPTRAQAKRARDLMRIHNRALAYVQEHAPDWDGNDPHIVWHNGKVWTVSCQNFATHAVGSVIGPEWVMRQLANDLNDGRVKL